MDKVFIYRDRKAIIICPKCDKSKAVDVSEHVHTHEAVKLKHPCACGYVYNVLLEKQIQKNSRFSGNIHAFYFRTTIVGRFDNRNRNHARRIGPKA